MGQHIKSFSDGSFLEYDRGSFDDWCVYLTQNNGFRRPPRDTDYFRELKHYAHKYGTERIYADYVKVYEMTGKIIDNNVLSAITRLSVEYAEDATALDVILSILYMAMIAEEQKKNTRLGQRIKRLGIHVLLIEDREVRNAANFMRGMGWRDIDRLCRERGF